jgi:hypothetical protein
LLIYSMEVNIYHILDLETKVHSIWVIWTNNLQECQGQACQGWDRLGSGDRGSDFFSAAPARYSDAFNARQGYLESPTNSLILS